MAGLGESYNGNFLVAEQTVFGTPATPNIVIPIMGESVKGDTPRTAAPSTYGRRGIPRQYQGVKGVAGGIDVEVLPALIVLLIKWLCGKAADIASSALPAPTSPGVTAAAGGTNADGIRKYKVANVFQRTIDGKQIIGNVSSEVSVTFATGNNTGTVTWTNATPPTGYTVIDSIVYATTIGGSTNTEHYLATKGGATTGYSDTGAVASTTIVPIAPMYKHVMTLPDAASATNPLLFFSVLKNMDNGTAQHFWDCMMGKATFSGSNNVNDPCKIAFDLLGCDFDEHAEAVPSIPAALQPAMRWQAGLGIDGVLSNRLEAFSVEIDNKIGYPDGATGGTNKHRNIYPNGRRTVTGTITLGAEANTEWAKMKDGTPFSLDIMMDASAGTPLAATALYDPWPLGLELYLGSCYYTGAGGNLNGDNRMTQALPIATEIDSNGDDIIITIYNTSPGSTYADAS